MFESLGVIDYPTFLLGSLLIILCPGPNSLFVLRTSVIDGARVAFAGACAVFLGDSVLLLAAYLGVAAIILANPTVFFALKCAGAAYLAYLASQILIGTWRLVLRGTRPSAETPAAAEESGTAAAKPEARSEGKRMTAGHAFRTALMLSLSNPKAILFMLSFFMPFIDTTKGHPGLAFLTLALTLQFWSVCYLTTLTQIGKALLYFFGRRPLWGRIGNSAVAALFLFFAWKLVTG